MPATEANTIAIVSSIQLKISGSHYRASDVVGIHVDDEKYAGKADDRNAGLSGKPVALQDSDRLGEGRRSLTLPLGTAGYPL